LGYLLSILALSFFCFYLDYFLKKFQVGMVFWLGFVSSQLEGNVCGIGAIDYLLAISCFAISYNI
jgi:hypothetical protein